MDYGFLDAPIYNHSSSFAVYIRVVTESVGSLGQAMSRDVPFDENAICDGCGTLGAFDFMGDFFCPKCLAKGEIDKQSEPRKITSSEDKDLQVSIKMD